MCGGLGVCLELGFVFIWYILFVWFNLSFDDVDELGFIVSLVFVDDCNLEFGVYVCRR